VNTKRFVHLNDQSQSRCAVVSFALPIKLVMCVAASTLPICASAHMQATLSELASFKASTVCGSYSCGRPRLKDSDYQCDRTDPRKQLSEDRTRTDSFQRSDISRNSYLNLVIELRSDRSFKVIKAGEIAGQLILPDYPLSNFVYEVTSDRGTLVVGFFAEDPFTIRGFADQQTANETSTEGKSATIVINIPLTGVTSAVISKLHVRIIKLVSEPGTEMTSADLKQLLEKKKALLLYDLAAKKLGPAIRKKLVKLRD